MEKVLLDTDIGGDIDDAVCPAYLLREPVCAAWNHDRLRGAGKTGGGRRCDMQGRGESGSDCGRT